MMTLIIVLNSNVFSGLAKRFNEGGPFFMSLILLCLIVSLGFIIFGFLNLKTDIKKSKKMISLASDTSLLGHVFGFLGSTIGLITAFDTLEAVGDISSGMMAAGLKISFLTIVFGCITFILSRIGIIILKGLHETK
ncbi:hypothetical protein GCM10022393_38580 [Aquimarina addita]|uniref:MotA/TolQ/ExbB proton channel domain-containing protein n=1 Tax=Aquimarina addita TaxID=870485 RepID=A0ABP6UT45_9FLAO